MQENLSFSSWACHTWSLWDGRDSSLEAVSSVTSSHLPRLTMAANKGRRNQSTGRCNPLWEESEMGLQRKIHPGNLNPCMGQPNWLNHATWEGEAMDHVAWEHCWPRGSRGWRRTPTGPPWGRAMQFWIKNRSLPELPTSISFPELRSPDWPGLARGGRTVHVYGYLVLRDFGT